jgi:DNA invertase Pin-like site-specific DNA recombinase
MAPRTRPGTRRYDVPDDEIIVRYDADEPVTQIAASYGVSTPVIYTRLREQGHRLRLPRITDDLRATALSLYQAGLSDTAVAEKLGISRATVRKVVADAGVKRATPEQVAAEHLRSPVMQEIVRRRLAGESVRALAAEYGIPRNTLARRLARAQDADRTCA